MTTTIQHIDGAITPMALEGYSASRTPRSVIHDVQGRPSPDVAFREVGLREGTFTIVFEGAASAFEAYDALAIPQVFTLANTDIPGLAMAFVVADDTLDIEQDDEAVELWRIAVPFREVAP